MKRVIYYAESEFGKVRFYKLATLMKFLNVFYPKWISKIRVFKKKKGIYFEGKYFKRSNGNLGVKF